jgi:hypothetical protein
MESLGFGGSRVVISTLGSVIGPGEYSVQVMASSAGGTSDVTHCSNSFILGKLLRQLSCLDSGSGSGATEGL